MIRIVIFILAFHVCGVVFAANDKAFFWQVKSDHATVYLMGSIHFADKSFYPLRPIIEQAFEDSNTLVVELNVKDVDHQTYLKMISEQGTYKDATTIADVLSAETLLQLRQRLHHLNLDYEAVKKYKPGILVLTLSAAQVTQMGFDAELGIDTYFLSKALAQAQAKEIVELESLAQQLQLFLDIPNGDLLLKESLYSLDEAEVMMAEMVSIWKQGDVDQMNKMLFEDAISEYPAFTEIYDKLFYDRNKAMVEQIMTMLGNKKKAGESYFIVVGSGHLIGEHGILQALQKRGFSVKRI